MGPIADAENYSSLMWGKTKHGYVKVLWNYYDNPNFNDKKANGYILLSRSQEAIQEFITKEFKQELKKINNKYNQLQQELKELEELKNNFEDKINKAIALKVEN